QSRKPVISSPGQLTANREGMPVPPLDPCLASGRAAPGRVLEHVFGPAPCLGRSVELVSGEHLGKIYRMLLAATEGRVAELSSRSCPTVLGIDEHFFTRKQGYATTLVDLHHHKVFDVVLGRSEGS